MGLKSLLAASILMATFPASAASLIDASIESYKGVISYSVTLRSSKPGSAAPSEVIRYFYRRPGYVRMEFVRPHKGAVLVYDPEKKEVRLRPFPSLKALVLTMSPENRLIRSAKGHTVDKSDIGALLDNVLRLKMNGTEEVLGEEAVGGRSSVKIIVRGGQGETVDGVGSYELYLDRDTLLPLKALAFDGEGGPAEEVLMDDLDADAGLSEGFFTLD